MKKIEITESNKYLLSALADCPIGTEITFNDGVIEVGKKEFKNGDFLIREYDVESLFVIFKTKQDDDWLFSSHWSSYYESNEDWKLDYFRLCTEAERYKAIEELNLQGKDWDAEKMEIVDYVWKPKKGDKIYSIEIEAGKVCEYITTIDNRKLTIFDFRTKELAEAALEVLKNLKHY